jgi:hypothetical protein
MTNSEMFEDQQHAHTGEGYDKYRTERDYEPYSQARLGKFQSGHPSERLANYHSPHLKA